MGDECSGRQFGTDGSLAPGAFPQREFRRQIAAVPVALRPALDADEEKQAFLSANRAVVDALRGDFG
jgi:hypothetical protein